MTHTPGPWHTDGRHPDVLTGEGRNERTVATTAGWRWANGECLANARLIAAAPDMLEALTGIERVLGNMLRARPDDQTIPTLIRWAAAARAKATGAQS